MSVIVASRTRGRRGVPSTVTVRETELAEQRLEFVAHLAESMAFAERVHAIGRFLSTPRPSNVVVNLGGELAYQASRRQAQIGSVVL